MSITNSNVGSNFKGSSLPSSLRQKKKVVKISGKVSAAAAVETSPAEEIKEYNFQSQTPA